MLGNVPCWYTSTCRDRQDLIQASLEQLRRPSLSVGVLPFEDSTKGDHLVLDLEQLSQSKTSLLVEKAFQTPDHENEKLYTKIRERIDRLVTSC